MADRDPALPLMAGPFRGYRRDHPVLTGGGVVLVIGLLGVASFFAVGPFAALACDSGPQLSVREAPSDRQGVTPYEHLTDSQQRLFDRARNTEDSYYLNEIEAGIGLPQHVEHQDTVYDIRYGHAECVFETNPILGVGLLTVSGLLGVGIALWNMRRSP